MKYFGQQVKGLDNHSIPIEKEMIIIKIQIN